MHRTQLQAYWDTAEQALQRWIRHQVEAFIETKKADEKRAKGDMIGKEDVNATIQEQDCVAHVLSLGADKPNYMVLPQFWRTTVQQVVHEVFSSAATAAIASDQKKGANSAVENDASHDETDAVSADFQTEDEDDVALADEAEMTMAVEELASNSKVDSIVDPTRLAIISEGGGEDNEDEDEEGQIAEDEEEEDDEEGQIQEDSAGTDIPKDEDGDEMEETDTNEGGKETGKKTENSKTTNDEKVLPVGVTNKKRTVGGGGAGRMGGRARGKFDSGLRKQGQNVNNSKSPASSGPKSTSGGGGGGPGGKKIPVARRKNPVKMVTGGGGGVGGRNNIKAPPGRRGPTRAAALNK